jgi:hypothetical protein
MAQHVDLEESNNAMLEIFPPEYYGLQYDQEFTNEVEGLLDKFAGSKNPSQTS